MKPNFALSLSFEGISLLRRVEGGWHLLGEVALDADDLASELADLREMAIALDGPEFRTKLVLPNDQIKFLSLDTGRQSETKRMAAAVEALEDSTPYSANDLSFVIEKDGRKTHVAAVARETMDEAESFANEHAFNPVCFVAIPDAETGFKTEPFWGLSTASTDLLQGATLDPDALPIQIVGSGPLPTPTPAAPDTPAPETPAPPEDTPSPAKPEDAPDAAPMVAPAAPAAKVEEAEDTPPPAAFSSIRAQRGAPEPSESAPSLGAAQTLRVNTPSLPSAGGASSFTENTEPRFDPAKLVAGFKITDDDPASDQDSAEGSDSGSSFFSRRKADDVASSSPSKAAKSTAPSKDKPAPKPKAASLSAREANTSGKPRFLGLILTAILLVALAAVAAWASIFLEEGVSGLFKGSDEQEERIVIVAPSPFPEDQPEPTEKTASIPLSDIVTIPEGHAEKQPVETVHVRPEALETETTPTEVAPPVQPKELSEQDAKARYAVTGIWERAPLQSATPAIDTTDDLYVASIDADISGLDAVALPATSQFVHDAALSPQLSAPAAGTLFDLDDRGLVVATTEGALSPDGVVVYLGRPSVLPQSFPDRSALAEAILSQENQRLAAKRPRARPGNLVENSERVANGGLSLAELGNKRPKARPASLKVEEELDLTPTKLAVKTSLKPRLRPANIAQLASRATAAAPVVASPVSATVKPSIPSKASVARQATIKNAINLSKVNLIGVYGTSSSRRALVRLSTGRYKKVKVGDRIDGGKVSAIGETELRYVKSGKNVVLKLPKG
ncbi:hypothetical protein Q8W25_07380 [Shimia thalassica]|uniref:hypothetical protein n=1 Tax=Shimia thalassica TaxID=1715693 RepID=UPI002734B9DC|nr:hypothetical protein [Shimia thalassica]MDP2493831.1 hypothetical protein [Shimia thalassica]